MEGVDDLSDPQLVCIGYNIIYNTDVFNTACREWQDKSMAYKTRNHLKSYFKKWDKYRQLTAASMLEGYHGAHHVDTAAPPHATVSQELIKLHAQLQAMQLALSKKSYPLTHSLKQCPPPSCSSRWSPERTHHPLSPLYSLLTAGIMDSL